MATRKSKNHKGKNQMPPQVLTRGSLPSLRAASVDILRTSLRDNECYTFDLQITPLVFSPAAGVIKQRFQMQSGAVQILNSLMACFEEIRFLGVRLRPKIANFYSNQSTNSYGQGYCKLWIDDAILTGGSPSYTDAFSRQTVDVDMSPTSQPNPRKQELQWIATDTEDLDWLPIPGSPTTFCPFTVAAFAAPGFTPGTSAGTGTNAADSYTVVMLDGAVRVQLRTLRTA